MNAPRLHLNLMRESEHRSSSPVRLRVMMPVLSLLTAAGCLVWWALLFAQLLVVRAQTTNLRNDLESKRVDHATILAQMASVRDLQAELDQLAAYAHGRRVYGNLLARLADIMPPHVQLTSLVLPPAPLPNLNPPGSRRPLLGPTGTVENVTLRLTGRTTKATPVSTLMESLEAPAFSGVLVIDKDPKSSAQSPKIISFRQDAAGADNAIRLLVFDIEYRCPDRRFEK